jgi:hypothetical protein
MFRGVGQFAREHGGVTLRVAEGFEGRQLHIVRAFGAIGAGATRISMPVAAKTGPPLYSIALSR